MSVAGKSADTIAELIDEGQPLVRSLASQIYHKIPVRVDYEDLVAYGQVGLAEAARDFDPDEGVKFVTYAFYRIRGAIYDGLAKMTWTSRAMYRRLRYERQADEALRMEREESSTTPSAADDTRWLRRVTDRLAVVYLATQGGRDDEDDAMANVVDRGASPSSVVVSREISEKLRTLVNGLPPVERELVNRVYFEGLTLQEAAVRVGVSKSWASRLHAKALEQLAKSLRRWGIADGITDR